VELREFIDAVSNWIGYRFLLCSHTVHCTMRVVLPALEIQFIVVWHVRKVGHWVRNSHAAKLVFGTLHARLLKMINTIDVIM
jgi:hypothetical protein